MSARWLAAVPVALALALGACWSAPTGTQPVDTTPLPPETTLPPGTTPTQTSDPSVSAPTRVPVEVVDGLLEWSVVAGPAETLMPPAAVASDGERLLFTVAGPLGHALYLREPGAQDASPLLLPKEHTLVGEADVSSELAVALIGYLESEIVSLVMWDLTGASLTVDSGPLMDSWAWMLALDGDRLYFVRDVGGVRCLAVASMEGVEQDPVYCTSPDWILNRVAVHPTVVSMVETDPVDGCSRLVTVDKTSYERTTTWNDVEDCRLFSGAADGSMAIWTHHPVPDAVGGVNYFDVEVVGYADGAVYDLGRGTAGSVSVCAGAAIWESKAATGEAEIRWWRPGEPVKVLYRSPDQGRGYGYATGRPECDDGQILIMRAGWQPGAPDEILVTPEVEWSVAVPDVVPIPKDPVTYVQKIRDSPFLSAWGSAYGDQELIEFADVSCEEMSATPKDRRVNHLYDPDTESLWTSRMGMTDPEELWVWRQLAFRYVCTDYYLLTLGD